VRIYSVTLAGAVISLDVCGCGKSGRTVARNQSIKRPLLFSDAAIATRGVH